MPVALKAQWVVQGGLIPGQPMEEYSRFWSYTSAHYEEDGGKRGNAFDTVQKEASEYATRLENGGLNWVTLSYIWM